VDGSERRFNCVVVTPSTGWTMAAATASTVTEGICVLVGGGVFKEGRAAVRKTGVSMP